MNTNILSVWGIPPINLRSLQSILEIYFAIVNIVKCARVFQSKRRQSIVILESVFLGYCAVMVLYDVHPYKDTRAIWPFHVWGEKGIQVY